MKTYFCDFAPSGLFLGTRESRRSEPSDEGITVDRHQIISVRVSASSEEEARYQAERLLADYFRNTKKTRSA
jgi:hypothetical protein